MVTKVALVLQNVKHEFAPHRFVGPRLPLGADGHGGPRRAGSPRRSAAAVGAAQWAAYFPGTANGLRHQPRVAQHPVEGAAAVVHRGSRIRGLFAYRTWPFADDSALAA